MSCSRNRHRTHWRRAVGARKRTTWSAAREKGLDQGHSTPLLDAPLRNRHVRSRNPLWRKIKTPRSLRLHRCVHTTPLIGSNAVARPDVFFLRCCVHHYLLSITGDTRRSVGHSRNLGLSIGDNGRGSRLPDQADVVVAVRGPAVVKRMRPNSRRAAAPPQHPKHLVSTDPKGQASSSTARGDRRQWWP